MTIPEYREDGDWIITFRPAKNFGAPSARRMARLLKGALRCYGFHVVDYFQPHQPLGRPMTPAQAEREMQRLERKSSGAAYCPRCGEYRRDTGQIVHRDNCPILVALRGSDGQKKT